MLFNNLISVKLKYILPGILVCCIACFAQQTTPISQGLTGYVYQIKGNQMPSPSKPTSKGRGMACDIYIYEPATITATTGSMPMFTNIKSRLVAHTHSDSTGHYSVKLKAGKYSVFIKTGFRFFASETDGFGILSPVEIKPGRVTIKNIIFNSKAAY